MEGLQSNCNFSLLTGRRFILACSYSNWNRIHHRGTELGGVRSTFNHNSPFSLIFHVLLQQIWKLKKVLKLRLNRYRDNVAEVKTREFDAESMRYLSYLLYPLVIGGAIYSLFYQPHKR